MNKFLKQRFLPCALLMFTVVACDNTTVNPGNDVRPVNIPAPIASGTNDFAIGFLKTLQQTQPANENVFVSPLSLHMALGMLLNGAENETAQEILKTLKMEGISMDDLNKAYKTLTDELPKADSKVQLGLANSVWYKNGFPVENAFQDLLKKTFNAEITGLEFNDAAKNKINQWASDKTNGKIKKVLDQISPDEVMFLLNALYFKGDWATKFDATATADTPFKLESGADKNVKMMYSKSDYKIADGEKYKAVQLPYANGQFNMTLLIPKGDNTVGNMISELTPADWADLQTNRLKKSGAKVGLPRFTLDYSVQLKNTLKAMGINKAFVSNAQFDGISKAKPLFVSFVKQDAYLGIDEAGTEAAAVTTIGMVLTSVGSEPSVPEFICNRPFALVISENTSNTILFMGRIHNPESK
jgi:serine protease inhibitor